MKELNGKILARIILAILLGLNIHNGVAQSAVKLTEEEKVYLQQLGPVTICIDPDWKPFVYIDENDSTPGTTNEKGTGLGFGFVQRVYRKAQRQNMGGECRR
jgi:hypothetical protein